ncbi:hypothetical protein CI109_104879 [Kwoniella shandongensis]|uniref:Uncharacterized protein n=1 Tax=Kwoniella shandongensis TaxID=1734106 RepID=A0A5M6BQL7_9TREE|nr:uncharacterized protein CI109_006598 [Kwoniella shandongensis]KAA5525047.1 hypothetical protein CI109_006598 [Kwoniella shandongensis]
MVSSAELGPVSQQYGAAATVPLIKSPSLWLPKPVELPNDIHPLPEDITAYFVYPFTLEEHVLSIHPSPHEAISQRRARNAEILHQREVEEEQRERDTLRRIAPGYNPSSLLVPKSASTPTPVLATTILTPSSQAQKAEPQSQSDLLEQHFGGGAQSTTSADSAVSTSGKNGSDPLDDLVAQLEEMESR